MRIAVFTDLFLEQAGGIPSVIKAQKKSLETMGHEVKIFCPGIKTDDKSLFLVPTRIEKISGVPVAKSVEKIVEYIEKNIDIKKFDIIHVHHEMGCSIAGLLIGKKYNIPTVQTMHGREDVALLMNAPFGLKNFIADMILKLQQRYLLSPISAKDIMTKDFSFIKKKSASKMWQMMITQAVSADIVTVPSKHFGAKFEEIFKSFNIKKRIVVVENGIDDDFFDENVEIRDYKADRPLEILWNSRVSKEKRIIVVLRALKKIDRSKYRMRVYGTGNQVKTAKKYVKKHNLNVQFMGQTPRAKIFEQMKKSDIGLMSSNGFDTQGMTLLEDEAFGLPIVFCDKDMMEIVPSGGAILTKNVGPDGFRDAFLDIINNPQKIKEMSEVMMKNRAEVFMNNRIEKLIKLYRELKQN